MELKLTDQTTLAHIATSDADPSVRLVAVRRLTDGDLHVRIARSDAHLGVREAAIDMIVANSPSTRFLGRPGR